MAVNKLCKQQQEVLELCVVDANKDFPGGSSSTSGRVVLRKASVIWKLLLLAFVGACGMYMCIIGVDTKLAYERLSLVDDASQAPVRTGRKHTCPRFSTTTSPVGFTQHYPQPRTFNRNECRCTPVHFFVILSMQRSGSGWFETLLNSHPNISSHGEVFSVRERRANFTTIKRTLDTIYNLDWQSSAAKNHCTAAVGFKWMVNQGALEHREEVAQYFKRRGVSVIILLRRNSLKRLISILGNAYDRVKPLNNESHVAHVHSKEEADLLASYKPTIDVATLVDSLRRVQQTRNEILSFFNVTRLSVQYYEDIVKDPKKVSAIQPFLGVPVRQLESRHVKIHTRPISELITNWDDVYRSLNGTEFQEFLWERDYL